MNFKSNNIHVFILDDDEFLLAAMQRSLETAGYKVTISNNVHDAYFKLNVLDPDIILMDVIMPDINGFEFLSLLQTPERSKQTPVILMSYLQEKEIRQMGNNFLNIPYLEKPFNFKALPGKIRKLLLINRTGPVTSTSSF